MFSPETRDADIAAITAFRQKTRKPLLAIQPFATPEEMAEALESVPKFQNGGVPVFPTTERATTALRKALDYYRGRQDRI
jgi:acyl-CoA synthetase (NDP forming)